MSVVTASLNGSRRIEMTATKEFCTVPSILDIYADRKEFVESFPDILEYNFLLFSSIFIHKGSKIEKRKRPVVIKTYLKYSSNPQNQHYGLFCKYQLLKYKLW